MTKTGTNASIAFAWIASSCGCARDHAAGRCPRHHSRSSSGKTQRGRAARGVFANSVQPRCDRIGCAKDVTSDCQVRTLEPGARRKNHLNRMDTNDAMSVYVDAPKWSSADFGHANNARRHIQSQNFLHGSFVKSGKLVMGSSAAILALRSKKPGIPLGRTVVLSVAVEGMLKPQL